MSYIQRNYQITVISFIVITVDIMDASGDNQDDIEDEVYKVSIDAEGDKKSEYHPVRQGSFFSKFMETFFEW